jgi:threonine synthase
LLMWGGSSSGNMAASAELVAARKQIKTFVEEVWELD